MTADIFTRELVQAVSDWQRGGSHDQKVKRGQLLKTLAAAMPDAYRVCTGPILATKAVGTTLSGITGWSLGKIALTLAKLRAPSAVIRLGSSRFAGLLLYRKDKRRASMSDLSMLAVKQLGRGDLSEARRLAAKAVQSSPGDWHAHYVLGQSLRFSNDFPQAAKVLGRALLHANADRNRDRAADRVYTGSSACRTF